MTDRICIECREVFPQKFGLRPMKFCGALCRHRFYNKQPAKPRFVAHEKECDVCQTLFLNKRRNGRYCSEKCYAVAYSRQHPEENRAQAKAWAKQNPDKVKARYRIYRNRDADSRPWRYLLHSAKMRAKEKNIPFDITETWAKERWTGRCEITDVPFQKNVVNGPSPFSASIDRKKTTAGYTQDNSRFILWGCNAIKGVGTDEDMFEIALAIVRAFRKDSCPDQFSSPENKAVDSFHTNP